MTISLTRLLTVDEYAQMNNDAISRGLYRDDPHIFLPGMGWYQPWYWDHDGSWRARGKHVMIIARPVNLEVRSFLSPHYWRDWADKRPPLCIIGPTGEQWEIDRTSSNGNGWIVTGEWPNITCSPSIVLKGYHGYLQNGVFTPDLEGRKIS
jgi:hypothetical protein